MIEEGHNEATAGAFMAMTGLLSIAAGPLWGWLSDQWGRSNALTTALVLVTLAMELPLVDQSLVTFFLHFLIMGLSVNGMFALIQASATDQVAPRYIPIAFSFVTVFFALGQLVGPAVTGWFIESSGGFRAAFGFTFVVLLAGAYLTLKIRQFPAEYAVGATTPPADP
jgi:MFS family permease